MKISNETFYRNLIATGALMPLRSVPGRSVVHQIGVAVVNVMLMVGLVLGLLITGMMMYGALGNLARWNS